MATQPVILKTDTSDNWHKCEGKYIPASNTIIVYQDDGQMPKIKFADGKHFLQDLPFLNNYAPQKSYVEEDTEILNLNY